MNFEFKCPQCGQTVEADDSMRGQVAPCPYCEKNIVVPKDNPSESALTATVVPKAKTAPRQRFKTHVTSKVTYLANDPMSNNPPQGIKKYFTSKGRAGRMEFWICTFLPIPFTGLLGWVRRLHDLNKCEWWLLAPIACFVAARMSEIELVRNFAETISVVWLIILGSLDGTSGDNDYGPDPKGRVGVGRKTPAAAIVIPILVAITVVGTLLAPFVSSLLRTNGSKGRETMSESSDDREARDTDDMVTVDGVKIRRLPDAEFKKITDEDGNEIFRAVLPERDGFTPGVLIISKNINFASMPFTAQQMRNMTHQDIREFMDGLIPDAVKQIQENLEAKGLECKVKVEGRVGNTVILLIESENGCEYHKYILDTRNGRFVDVIGAWKSFNEKYTIKACVDSARLAAQ